MTPVFHTVKNALHNQYTVCDAYFLALRRACDTSAELCGTHVRPLMRYRNLNHADGNHFFCPFIRQNSFPPI